MHVKNSQKLSLCFSHPLYPQHFLVSRYDHFNLVIYRHYSCFQIRRSLDLLSELFSLRAVTRLLLISVSNIIVPFQCSSTGRFPLDSLLDRVFNPRPVLGVALTEFRKHQQKIQFSQHRKFYV